MRKIIAFVLLFTLAATAQTKVELSTQAKGTLAASQLAVHHTSLLVGTCSGVATSSTTVFLFPLGQNSAFTCTITTATLGIPVGAGTVKNLFVVSSANGKGASTVVTVLKNASAQTLTCSMSGVALCNDQTHSFTTAAGDKITVSLATAASETIANVAVSVEFWN